MPWEPPHRIWGYAEGDMERQIAARDLFALGCYLVRVGHDDAGMKACWSALQGLHAPLGECQQFIATLKTDGEWILENIGPHAELHRLFESVDQ